MPGPESTGLRQRERRPRRDRTQHHLVAIPIVDFSASAPPDWVRAPVGGYLDLGAGLPLRHLHDVGFRTAGLVGAVSQPFAIGREFGGGFRELVHQQRPGLAVADSWRKPDLK